MKSDPLKPGLYVTATPIGNLGDITYRAVETMKAADYILCEDTRRTAKLCQAYGIETARRPYHEHNAASVRPGVLRDLADGAVVCLVSDAGTPLISDPGYKLVAEARAASALVSPLPGPCAAIAALSVSGAPTDRFYFAGFPPPKSGSRRAFIGSLKSIDATLVFYESAGRLSDFLRDAAAVAPGRNAFVARELTKIYESFESGDPVSIADRIDAAGGLKGEIVILLAPPIDAPPAAQDLDAFLREALSAMSVRDAAAAAADATGVAKKTAYERAIQLSKEMK